MVRTRRPMLPIPRRHRPAEIESAVTRLDLESLLAPVRLDVPDVEQEHRGVTRSARRRRAVEPLDERDRIPRGARVDVLHRREELREHLTVSKLAGSDVDYSEHGMQGNTFVSLDVGKEFIDSWKKKVAQFAI